ncbi:MAG: ATP-binding cassette domain-containing protein [Gemmatimonadota bacterium]
MTLALQLLGIHKRFGSVKALTGADFSLEKGEIHALLGENGAGKSTLMHIAAGMVKPDQGAILVHGSPLNPGSPRSASRAGVGMVHQHFTSIPAFSVGENVALAAKWAVQPRRIHSRVVELSQRLGFDLDPDVRVETLSVTQLQRLEIVKALATGATILLFDEPTGSLAPQESDALLHLIERLVLQGGSAVLITHKLNEALKHAKRLTVLRRGEVTLQGAASQFTAHDLARAMLGEDMPSDIRAPGHSVGGVVVDAVGISVMPIDGRGPGLLGATFQLRAGEVVGLAAVQGNGERELIRAVAGLVRPSRGTLSKPQPVAFVPEDRTNEGLIAQFSITENMILGSDRTAPWVHHGLLDTGMAGQAASRLIERFGIIAPGPDVTAGSLSGGNQQKLILARALEMKSPVIVAENPTRGLDVRAARSALRQLAEAAAGGAAVMIYCTDLDELFLASDRILVVSGGRVIEAPPRPDREMIGRLMLSGASAA